MENSHVKHSVSEFIYLVCRALVMAMGVAAFVLSVLGTTTPSTLITLLAIGLFCLALGTLNAPDR